MNPTTPITSLVTDLNEQADYPETGVRNKPLHKDEQTQHSLMCLAAGTTIAEHTSPRNVTVMVVAGQGTLTLEGREIRLQPGVFIIMPANAPHALQTTNSTLAFLHSKW
ncbi:cupin domain-containing protein [Phormidesmis priestleyi ULC007]|uniref:Cupin domain-containing protein n=1 Tax=Phormidesmis priestleyi ULC007 TaxID=1920490 RepID=A0A2T1DGL2_9CYAN|nr:cupin domain-containing protein [Phormidesmis priestleyi]PSB19632.1 cupin domain-containing protein [Phormidesmis priestleyi ULC007]PZO53516.1 MAG: cupin domain-containing protein [Phormidesmis priestleyi]